MTSIFFDFLLAYAAFIDTLEISVYGERAKRPLSNIRLAKNSAVGSSRSNYARSQRGTCCLTGNPFEWRYGPFGPNRRRVPPHRIILRGERWYGQAVEGEREFIVVNSYENGTVALAGLKGAYLSRDGGKTWAAVALPKYVSGVYNLTMTPGPAFWLGTRQGALRSTDGGQTWQYMLGGLPKNDVLAVRYDPSGQRLLATALHSHAVFQSKDGGQSWQSTPEAGVSIRAALNYKGRLLVASFYNGLLLEQESDGASGF